MNLDFSGKVAFVAASSEGIGFSTAEVLAKGGARVSICGRREDKLSAALARLGRDHFGAVCDVTKADSIKNWVRQSVLELGTPDILITNTGGPKPGFPTQLSEQDWYDGFESTFLNVIRLVELVVPYLKKKKWGRIVHLTSLVAKDPGLLLTISSTLRSGLSTLTRLQAKELAEFGITVNAVLPGHTLTERQKELLAFKSERNHTSLDEEMQKAKQAIPLRRIATPDEIAYPIGFLCSPMASYVTGSLLVVDGGLTSGLG